MRDITQHHSWGQTAPSWAQAQQSHLFLGCFSERLAGKDQLQKAGERASGARSLEAGQFMSCGFSAIAEGQFGGRGGQSPQVEVQPEGQAENKDRW